MKEILLQKHSRESMAAGSKVYLEVSSWPSREECSTTYTHPPMKQPRVSQDFHLGLVLFGMKGEIGLEKTGHQVWEPFAKLLEGGKPRSLLRGFRNTWLQQRGRK